MKITIAADGVRINGKSALAVRLFDYSGYEPDMGTNGGKYAFWETIHFDGDRAVSTEGTTAEFYICREPHELTANEAVSRIVRFASFVDGIDTFMVYMDENTWKPV